MVSQCPLFVFIALMVLGGVENGWSVMTIAGDDSGAYHSYCKNKKDFQERLDAQGGSLAGFQTIDQDGLGICYSAATSVLLKSVIPFAAQFDPVSMALSTKMLRLEYANKEENRRLENTISGGDVCDTLSALRASGGACQTGSSVFSRAHRASTDYSRDVKNYLLTLPKTEPYSKMTQSQKNELKEKLSLLYEKILGAGGKGCSTELEQELKFSAFNRSRSDPTFSDLVGKWVENSSHTERKWQWNSNFESQLRNMISLNLLSSFDGEWFSTTIDAYFNSIVQSVRQTRTQAQLKRVEYQGSISTQEKEAIKNAFFHSRYCLQQKGKPEAEQVVASALKNCTDCKQTQSPGVTSGQWVSLYNQFNGNKNLPAFAAIDLNAVLGCLDGQKIQIPENISCKSVANFIEPLEEQKCVGDLRKQAGACVTLRGATRVAEFTNQFNADFVHSLNLGQAMSVDVCSYFLDSSGYSNLHMKKKNDCREHGHVMVAIGQKCEKGVHSYLLLNSHGAAWNGKTMGFTPAGAGRAWLTEEQLFENMTGYSVLTRN